MTLAVRLVCDAPGCEEMSSAPLHDDTYFEVAPPSCGVIDGGFRPPAGWRTTRGSLRGATRLWCPRHAPAESEA